MSLSQGQKCWCKPSWSSYNLQFFVTATVPSVDINLILNRLFCWKINQWVILWVWDSLVLVGARKSPSAGFEFHHFWVPSRIWSHCCRTLVKKLTRYFPCIFYIGNLYDLTLATHTYLTHNQKEIPPNRDYSMCTVKDPLSLFRTSSFASHSECVCTICQH